MFDGFQYLCSPSTRQVSIYVFPLLSKLVHIWAPFHKDSSKLGVFFWCIMAPPKYGHVDLSRMLQRFASMIFLATGAAREHILLPPRQYVLCICLLYISPGGWFYILPTANQIWFAGRPLTPWGGYTHHIAQGPTKHVSHIRHPSHLNSQLCGCSLEDKKTAKPHVCWNGRRIPGRESKPKRRTQRIPKRIQKPAHIIRASLDPFVLFLPFVNGGKRCIGKCRRRYVSCRRPCWRSRRRRRLRLDFLLASSGIDLQKLNDQLLKMINPTLKGWQV